MADTLELSNEEYSVLHKMLLHAKALMDQGGTGTLDMAPFKIDYSPTSIEITYDTGS